jgi:hypothetical protein
VPEKSHLKQTGRSYLNHAGHALRLSSTILRIGLAGVVHAIVPQLFKTHMSDGMSKVRHMITKEKTRIRVRR